MVLESQANNSQADISLLHKKVSLDVNQDSARNQNANNSVLINRDNVRDANLRPLIGQSGVTSKDKVYFSHSGF